MELPISQSVVARGQLLLNDDAWAQLSVFGDMLVGEGQLAGATAPIVDEEADRRHIAESLEFGALVAGRGLLAESARLADVGTGGGLPGIPLAIAFPLVHVTLVEANARKAAFLRAVVQRIGLHNVEVLAERAELIGRRPGLREQFDTVVSRAVAELRVLAELCLPLVATGGTMAAIKGSRVHDEVDSAAYASSALGGDAPMVTGLGPAGGQLSVVFIRKVSATPDRYPRRPGIPAKRPL